MEKQLSTVGSSTYEKIKHDIIFGELAPGSKLKLDVIKTKYEETNALWHQENLEKQKLEAVIEQQYRESMELDGLRRKAEEDKHFFRNKNIQFKREIGELVKENKKFVAEKTALGSRL